MSDRLDAVAAAGYPVLRDAAVDIDPAAARLVSRDEHSIGLAVAADVLHVAIADVPSPARHAELETLAGMAVAISVTTPQILTELRERAQAAGSTHPVHAFTALLREADQQAASDIILTCGRRPALRNVNGTSSSAAHAYLTASDLDVLTQWLMPATQRRAVVKAGTSRWRVTRSTRAGAPLLTLRRVVTSPPTLTDIGAPIALVEAVERMRGLVLVTGPAGAGRTTTLAAAVNHINSAVPAHVVTIADPTEVTHPARLAVVTDLEVGPDCDNVAAGFGAAASADVVAAELSARDDVLAALRAALAGQLVLATFTAASVVDALTQIPLLFDANERDWVLAALARATTVLTCQQLLATPAGSRQAVFEVLTLTDPLRALVRSDALHLVRAAMSDTPGEAMITFDRALAAQCAAGQIGGPAARRAAYDTTAFDSYVGAPPTQDRAAAPASTSTPAGARRLATAQETTTPAPPAAPARSGRRAAPAPPR